MDFAAYRDERLKSIKASTLAREFATLRHVFEVARDEWGLPISENPVAMVRVVPTQQRRERRLRPEEFERLVEATRFCRNKLILPIILLAVATGMRRGEILSLRWEHVDRAAKTLLIPTTKNGYARIIPLIEQVVTLLDQIPITSDLVFPLSANALRLTWDRIRRRTGSDDLHFHDLRHEAISRFFEAGLSVPEVALLSGHRDPRMLFRYTHPTRKQILHKLNRHPA
jgi:integrase